MSLTGQPKCLASKAEKGTAVARYGAFWCAFAVAVVLGAFAIHSRRHPVFP